MQQLNERNGGLLWKLILNLTNCEDEDLHNELCSYALAVLLLWHAVVCAIHSSCFVASEKLLGFLFFRKVKGL